MRLDLEKNQRIILDSNVILTLDKENTEFLKEPFLKYLKDNGLSCFLLDTVANKVKTISDQKIVQNAQDIFRSLKASMVVEIINTGRKNDDEAIGILTKTSKIPLFLVTNSLDNARNLLQNTLASHKAYFLEKGELKAWNLQEIEKLDSHQKGEEPREGLEETEVQAPKEKALGTEVLLISFIIDNSAVLKGERLLKLREAFKSYESQLIKNDLTKRIKYSITVFDNLNPLIIKKYNDVNFDFDKLFARGVPVLGEAIVTSLDDLNKTMKTESTKTKLYKPWVIILTGGENFGECDNACTLINNLCIAKSISYFPFSLVNDELSPQLIDFKKIKKPMTIADDNYKALFKWLIDFSLLRIKTASTEGLALNPKTFEGWTIK